MATTPVDSEEMLQPARSEGRRQELRRPYKGTATLARAGTNGIHQAAVIDVSSIGCLLRLMSKVDLDVDDLVDISVQSSDLSFRARGVVRHIREDGDLLGIRLDHLTARGKAMLLALTRELQDAGRQEGTDPSKS